MAKSRSSRSQQRINNKKMHQQQMQTANEKQMRKQQQQQEETAVLAAEKENQINLANKHSPSHSPRSIPSSPTINTVDAIIFTDPSSLDEKSTTTNINEEQHQSQFPSDSEQLQHQHQLQSTSLMPVPDASFESIGTTAVETIEPPTPTFTAEEENMRLVIQNVTDRLAMMKFEMSALKAQINNHCTRICMAKMSRSQLTTSLQSPNLTPSKLHLTHKQLMYAAGMIDERVMQVIFKLDAVQTDNSHIRSQRKATVARGNKLIVESMEMRNKLERWNKFMPAKEEQQQQQRQADTLTQQQQTTSVDAEYTVMVEDEEDTNESSDDEMEQKHAEPTAAVNTAKQQPQPTRSSTATNTHTTTPTPTLSTAAPITPPTPVLTSLQQKYAHLRLPEWSSGPAFQSRLHPSSGAFIISAIMNGIQSSDIKVTTDPIKRTLTISGVKLPKQRRINQQQQHQQQLAFGGFFGLAALQPRSQLPMEPHGFFTRVISFTDLDPHSVLDLSSMSATMDENERLEITIPRSSTRRTTAIPQAQQQQQRTQQLPYGYPTRQSTRYENYSDEEEEESMNSPDVFFQRTSPPQPRRQQSRMQYQRPSPFFGSSGWW